MLFNAEETEIKQALVGLKVLDFSWVITGPLATKYLGDHGATVIRVESMQRLDIMRPYPPYAGGIPGVNRGGSFTPFNSSKYSMTLNLNKPRGTEIARKLVAWSDVVVENFMAGQMEKWGLDYDELRKVRPDIIMVRASLQGQTGPYARQAGYGTMLQGSAGFTHFVGWPDRAPTGSTVPYTDFPAALTVTVAIMGALDYRRRTGKGQYIDLSQLEASVPFFSPAVLDYTVNGRPGAALGNRHPYAAPHGAYRCQGDDRWCAIVVLTDEEWQGFCHVIGKPELANDPRFDTIAGRKKNEDEVDKVVEEWTVGHSPEEIMTQMQAAGVPSGIVANGRDLHLDPQLKHRHHFWMLEHSEMGVTAYDGPGFRLSKTPVEIKMPSPRLGQHTEYICREILKMSDKEFIELLNEGVFE